MRKFRTLAATALVAVGLSVPAQAADEPTGPFGGNIAGTIAVATDYVFRGMSQTDNDPALQGSLEYSLPVAGDAAAAYVSIWGSNVRFLAAPNGGTVPGSGSLELDYTAGVRGTLFEKLGYDVNFIYYSYPGAQSSLNYDNVDVGAKLSYDLDFAAPYVGVRYSPDFYGGTDKAWYYSAGVGVPLAYGMLEPYKVKAMAEISRQTIENNTLYGAPDYTTWMLGVTASAFTLDFTLAYYDTNISTAQCFAGQSVCDSRIVFSVGKAF